MYPVTKEIFEEFVKTNDLKRVLGDCWGTEEYLDFKGIVKATADYGDFFPQEVYKIDDVKYRNGEDFEFLSKMLNR